jgi:hypothetical protein
MLRIGMSILVVLICGCASTGTNRVATTYGPVRNVVVPLSQPCERHYFQFRTGEVTAIGDGPADSSDHVKEYQDLKSRGGWDLTGNGGSEGLQIVGRGCTFTREGSPDWGSSDADVAVDVWKEATWVYGVVSPKKNDFPISYFFRTARDERGIVQVLGVTKDSRAMFGQGMQIRYKLVRLGKPSALPHPF